MPKLVFTQPEFAAQSCELPDGRTTVGRNSRNDLVILDHSVSADHCEILVSWNEVIVREHGSRNGTWVAGVRVTGQRPVNHRETVRFGQVEARLELPASPADDDTNTTHLLLDHAARTEPVAPPLHAVIHPGSKPPEALADRDVTINLNAPLDHVVPRASGPVAPPPPTMPAPNGSRLRRRLIAGLVVAMTLAAAWFWQR